MERINRILTDPDFLDYTKKNRESEAGRIYCRHDISHSLDVSRVACIINLEEKLQIGKEIIYATGLLHDIGRWMEYERGADHANASGALAAGILQKCGFSDGERAEIRRAIEGHREKTASSPLGELLYRADKLSRNCVGCGARSKCKRFQKRETPRLLY